MMRFQGEIREWDDARGFGFIGRLEGGERVFVHVSAFPVVAEEFVNYELDWSKGTVWAARTEGLPYLMLDRFGLVNHVAVEFVVGFPLLRTVTPNGWKN